MKAVQSAPLQPWSRRPVAVLITVSIVGAGCTRAQGVGPQVGVAAGLAVPISAYHMDPNAYGKGFNTGWEGMAIAAFGVPAWPIGVRLDGTYGVNNANTTLNDANDQFSTERSKVLGVNLDLSLFLRGARLTPYLIGGIGIYHATISITGGRFGPADTSETTFGWNLGAGLLYNLRGPQLFVEARYISVAGGLGFSCPLATSCARQPSPRTTVVPIVVGIRLGKP